MVDYVDSPAKNGAYPLYNNGVFPASFGNWLTEVLQSSVSYGSGPSKLRLQDIIGRSTQWVSWVDSESL